VHSIEKPRNEHSGSGKGKLQQGKTEVIPESKKIAERINS